MPQAPISYAGAGGAGPRDRSSRGLGIAALAAALVMGGLVTARLGLGDVRLTLAEGHATLNGPGVSGTAARLPPPGTP
ncbi:hypothetical protein Mame01_10500 [Microbispora amethystogenes]|nr:hypothetical protein Mame01_10500 [Microbispora amethystogenes]